MDLITFYIQTLLSALIAGVAFYRYSERDTGVRLIGVIFLISCFFNCVQYATLMMRLPFINQVGTVYVFINIIAGTVWYDHVLSTRFRKSIVLLSSVAVIWGLTVVFFVHDSGETTTLLNLGVSFLWILYSILYFYRLMQELPAIHLHRLPSFWFNSSFLTYGSGTFVLFAAYDYLVRVIDSFWTFNTCVFIVSQLLISIGLYYDLQSINKRHSSTAAERTQKQFLQK